MLKKFLRSYVFALVIGLVGLWALVKFLQWDQGDRDQGYRQLLPFKLTFTYEGEAGSVQSYTEGNGWYITFQQQLEDGSFSDCRPEIISFYDYEALLQVAANPEGLTIAPAWLYNSRSTGTINCTLMNTDWQKFYQIEPPALGLLQTYNRNEKQKAAQRNAAAAVESS